MFALPSSTLVQKVIPKNAFDTFMNSKQKKLMSVKIQRITWANKISYDTISLKGNEVNEIQIFKIELKEKANIKEIISVIDKAIPYHIIFCIEYQEEYYISTSIKHLHPTNSNKAVIDYTFTTNWEHGNINDRYKLELRNNLDWIFMNFCKQLFTSEKKSNSLNELLINQTESEYLKREIEKLEMELKKCKQFNKKVELKLKLNKLRYK